MTTTMRLPAIEGYCRIASFLAGGFLQGGVSAASRGWGAASVAASSAR